MSICEKCGQDHGKAMKCMGSKGGQAKKHPDAQSKNAHKRWAKYYKEHPDKVKKLKTTKIGAFIEYNPKDVRAEIKG